LSEHVAGALGTSKHVAFSCITTETIESKTHADKHSFTTKYILLHLHTTSKHKKRADMVGSTQVRENAPAKAEGVRISNCKRYAPSLE